MSRGCCWWQRPGTLDLRLPSQVTLLKSPGHLATNTAQLRETPAATWALRAPSRTVTLDLDSRWKTPTNSRLGLSSLFRSRIKRFCLLTSKCRFLFVLFSPSCDLIMAKDIIFYLMYYSNPQGNVWGSWLYWSKYFLYVSLNTHYSLSSKTF